MVSCEQGVNTCGESYVRLPQRIPLLLAHRHSHGHTVHGSPALWQRSAVERCLEDHRRLFVRLACIAVTGLLLKRPSSSFRRGLIVGNDLTCARCCAATCRCLRVAPSPECPWDPAQPSVADLAGGVLAVLPSQAEHLSARRRMSSRNCLPRSRSIHRTCARLNSVEPSLAMASLW